MAAATVTAGDSSRSRLMYLLLWIEALTITAALHAIKGNPLAETRTLALILIGSLIILAISATVPILLSLLRRFRSGRAIRRAWFIALTVLGALLLLNA